MADLNKMDRTWLCSVLFMDIVNYSSQSVELQMRWKGRFNGYLGEAIHDVPENERVILDTGDGAAVCFLGAPEAAMFAALQLCRAFTIDERDQQPGMRVRMGVNLGPVKLVRDINGALNALGDGINDGQRVMSFSGPNQILVSQSFFEVVSRLSDDYKTMFQFKGVEADKHVREHTVYRLTPPGTVAAHVNAVPPAPPRAAPGSSRARGARSMLWLACAGATLAVVAAAAATWYFHGSGSSSTPNPNVAAVRQEQASAPAPPDRVPPAPVASRSDKTALASARPDETRVAKAGTAPATNTPAGNTLAGNTPPPSQFRRESAPVVPATPDPAQLLREGKVQLANHNPAAARESFRNAADAGSPQAMVLLGTFCAQGVGGPKSDAEAVRLFRQAANLGYARGMYNLGLMLETGRGVPAGAGDQASDWYAKGASRGDGDAAYRLGLMYEEGRSVPRDLSEARLLYVRAGTPEAKERLARLPPQ